MNFNFNGSNVTINVSQKEFEVISDALVQTIPVNTYTLTDDEKYVFKCILHRIRPNDSTRSLLRKFDEDGDCFTNEDYDKVVFERDAFGDTVINFVENN